MPHALSSPRPAHAIARRSCLRVGEQVAQATIRHHAHGTFLCNTEPYSAVSTAERQLQPTQEHEISGLPSRMQRYSFWVSPRRRVVLYNGVSSSLHLTGCARKVEAEERSHTHTQIVLRASPAGMLHGNYVHMSIRHLPTPATHHKSR